MENEKIINLRTEKHSNMYSFTAVDPDHKMKGSRDPLGFQKIWSDTGRLLIKHLSTVSSNIHDFQIWCYANSFYMENPANRKIDFIEYFLKVEQAFAYARYFINNETGFNGTYRVSNRKEVDKVIISGDDQILSNQKAYGIYGKYSRPARDMRMVEHSNFRDIFLIRRDSPAWNIFDQIISHKIKEFRIEDLRPLADLIKELKEDERNFFRDLILISKVGEIKHPQEDLYTLLIANPKLAQPDKYNLFVFLQSLKGYNLSKEFVFVITEIDQTEKVLAPLNYHFSELLTKGIWTNKEFIANRSHPVNHCFKMPEVNTLNDLLGIKENSKFVRSLIKRNDDISKRRDSMGWFRIEGDRIVKLFGEAHIRKNGLSDTYAENPYFIPTYLSLFNQIENPKL